MPLQIGGKKISYWWIVGGGAGVVLIYYIYKKSSASNAAAAASTSSTSANAIDPVTGMPYSEDNSIDPITGMTYLQEAQQYGSVTAAEQEITSGSAYYGQSGYGSAIDSGYPTEGYYGVTGSTAPTGYTYSTNAQWAQAVTAGLVSLGYSATDVAAALGLYFAEQPLGSGADGVSYVSIIQAAIAEFGPPPQGTYPILPQPSSGGSTSTGTGTGSTGTVTVPNVVGLNYEAADKAITGAGLVINPHSSNGQASGIAGGGWGNPVTAQSPTAGSSVASGSTVTVTGSAARTGSTGGGGTGGGGTVNPGGPNQGTGPTKTLVRSNTGKAKTPKTPAKKA